MIFQLIDPMESQAFANVIDSFSRAITGEDFEGIEYTDLNYTVTQIVDSVVSYAVNRIAQATTSFIESAFTGIRVPMVGVLITWTYDIYQFGQSLSAGLDIAENVRAFLNVAMSSRYSAYWDMYRMGYIEQYEFLGLTGCSSMMNFYQKAGIPNSIRGLVTGYENGTVSEGSLISGMKLANWNQVGTTLGTAWTNTDAAAKTLSSSLGTAFTFSDVYNVLSSIGPILADASLNDRNDLIAQIETLKELNDDEISLTHLLDLTTVHAANEIGDGENSIPNVLLTPSSMFATSPSITSAGDLVPSRLIQNKLAVDTLNLIQSKEELVCDVTPGDAGRSPEFVASFGEGFDKQTLIPKNLG